MCALRSPFFQRAMIACLSILVILLIPACTSVGDEVKEGTPADYLTPIVEPSVDPHTISPIPLPTGKDAADQNITQSPEALHYTETAEALATLSPISPRETQQPEGTITPSPTPTEYNLPGYPTMIDSAIFLDEDQGWILGRRFRIENWWEYALIRTRDGGDSWSTLPIPEDVEWNEGINARIFFIDAHRGWLSSWHSMSPDYIITKLALYSTIDGGESWRAETPQGAIVDFKHALNGQFLATEVFEETQEWRYLVVEDSAYESWKELDVRLPPDAAYYDDFILQDYSHIWISDFVPESDSEYPDFNYILLFSSNWGQTWERLEAPCGGFRSGTSWNIATTGVGRSHLFIACGWSTGSGVGYVYFSNDGGRSWDARAINDISESTWSGGGHFHELNALSDDFVYINWWKPPDHSLSIDGGVNWIRPMTGCESGAVYLNQEVGWSYSNWDFYWGPFCLSRTLDGGQSWQCRLIPGGEPCEYP